MTLLDLAGEVERSWQLGIAYSARGDHNQLSYIKYLLLPRIPSGSDTYVLGAEGTVLPEANPRQTDVAVPGDKGPFGFFLSIAIIFGLGITFRKNIYLIKFSLPEMTGCGLMILMLSVVFSRVLFSTAVPGFVFLTFCGLISWGYILWLVLPRIPTMLQKGVKKIGELRKSSMFVWQLLLVFVIFSCVLWSFLMSVVVVPDDWDAWAIWGAKAKVLALGTGPLFDVSYFGHEDYPLLWPSVWAYSAWLSGGWEEMWSKGWGSVFLILCVWEIVVIVQRMTHRLEIGLLAGALFVSMPLVPLIASWSYAEAPFWFLTTSCAGCLLLRREDNGKILTLIAAVLGAAAAYTKNEGVLFSLLASGWILLIPGERRLSHMLLFLFAFAVCYLPWFYWTKVLLGIGSHATAGLHFDQENIQRVMARVPKALKTIPRLWADIKQWNIVLWISLLLTCFYMFDKEIRKALLLPVLLLVGYLTITLFIHAEIYWQLGTSWNRLTIHAMPLMLIVIVTQLCRNYYQLIDKSLCSTYCV